MKILKLRVIGTLENIMFSGNMKNENLKFSVQRKY